MWEAKEQAQYLWKENLNFLIFGAQEDRDLLDFQSGLLKL